jgi:mannosyltransferase OCH1-like enzyme
MIPKIIHQVWIQFDPDSPKQIEDNPKFKIQQDRVVSFCKTNNIDYKLWTDETASTLMKDKYPQHIEFYNNLRYPVQRTNFLRLLVLYEFGGLYIDMDISPIRKLDEVWEQNEFFIRWDRDHQVYTAVMGSSTKSELFDDIIKHFYESYNDKKDMVYYRKWKGKFIYHTSSRHMILRVLKRYKKEHNKDIKLWNVLSVDKKNLKCVGENPMFLDYNVNSWDVKNPKN